MTREDRIKREMLYVTMSVLGAQAFLEAYDELSGYKVFKHKFKNSANNFLKTAESIMDDYGKAIYEGNSDTYVEVSKSFDILARNIGKITPSQLFTLAEASEVMRNGTNLILREDEVSE